MQLKIATVPEEWRVANVTPILKKGRRGDLRNYRLVSLTFQERWWKVSSK